MELRLWWDWENWKFQERSLNTYRLSRSMYVHVRACVCECCWRWEPQLRARQTSTLPLTYTSKLAFLPPPLWKRSSHVAQAALFLPQLTKFCATTPLGIHGLYPPRERHRRVWGQTHESLNSEITCDHYYVLFPVWKTVWTQVCLSLSLKLRWEQTLAGWVSRHHWLNKALL